MCQFTYVDDTGNKQMNTPIPTQHQTEEDDISSLLVKSQNSDSHPLVTEIRAYTKSTTTTTETTLLNLREVPFYHRQSDPHASPGIFVRKSRHDLFNQRHSGKGSKDSNTH